MDDPQNDGLKLSFAQVSKRSSHMANLLRGLGIVWGNRLLLMLPDRVELWDVTLGVVKLGTVMLPATTQLSPDDVYDRVGLSGVTCAAVDAVELHKFDSMDVNVKRIAVGAQRDDWVSLAAAYGASA